MGFSPSNVVADYDYTHPLVKQNFKTLAEYAAGTGQEKHSILIGLDDFMKVTLPSRDNVQKLYNPADFDFRLRPGSKTIDAGVLLPTINDGFTGKAPDLGALESGTEPPHYGPRRLRCGLRERPGARALGQARSLQSGRSDSPRQSAFRAKSCV